MDHSVPRARDFEIDLEKGGAYGEEELSYNTVSCVKKNSKTLFVNICGGFVDGQMKVDDGFCLCTTTSNGVSMENVEAAEMKVEGTENVNSAEKKKLKKTNNKKAPKPPRPPKGPTLDEADKKLIRGIAELAMLKRARIERMKDLKKMQAVKSPPSSNSNLFAMVFTIIFFVMILFQGVSSRTSRSSGSLPGGLQDKIISAQYYGNQSPNDLHGHASGSPYSVEQVAGSSYPQERLQRFIR